MQARVCKLINLFIKARVNMYHLFSRSSGICISPILTSLTPLGLPNPSTALAQRLHGFDLFIDLDETLLYKPGAIAYCWSPFP
jgi:hypothetical protein